MKKTLFLIIAFLAFFACSKEDTPPDLCAGVTCLNGGNCANGACNCPDQYTGSDCSQQKTPVKIEVTKVVVTQFPEKNGSEFWDAIGDSRPDLFFTLSVGNTEIYSTINALKDNADVGTDYTWSIPATENLFLEDVTQEYIIRLFDDDFLPDWEFMGGISFTPYNNTNGFPEIRVLSCSNCVVAFDLYFKYYF